MPRTPLLLLALAALVPATIRAQAGPATTPVLLEPTDWGPNAAWRRRGAEVRRNRMALLRAGNLSALNAVRAGSQSAPSLVVPGALATAITGAFHVPVILIAYKDVAVPYPQSEFQRILFSRNPGDRAYTVTTFYEELSHHRITMDGVALAPVRMDSVAGFYTDGCNGITIGNVTTCPSRPANRMGAMLVTALDSINARPGGDTLWSQFDNDGADGLPNSGDDDGVVDYVTFLQPEVGGECRANTPPPTGIWSHRFVMAAWVPGGGSYITRTPRRNSAGQPIAGQFIRVNDYTIQSQVGGISACDGAAIMGVGTVAHETGHAFGLPDLYDTQGATEGIGGWGLMGSGNYSRPYSPSSYDAWSLAELGWATIDTLGSSRTITTGARLDNDTLFYARSWNPNLYLLIENRQSVRSDTAQMNPVLPSTCPILGFCAKSPGLLLWLIDRDRVNAGLPSNQVNTGGLQGVSLIQADGLNQLRVPGTRNRGDRGDAFPGLSGNNRFSLLTNPVARDITGIYLGFIVDRIEQLAGTTMRFRFSRREPSVISALKNGQVRINGLLWDRYEEVIPGGDVVQLSVDPQQVISGGRTRLSFLSWSDQGPRDRQLVSNPAKPDTLTANFSLENRLLIATSGAGTVTASIGGDLSQGVYLQDGAPVSLTATPSAGFSFVGWRGDTTATAPTLNLSMRRGYDLEARFIQALVIPAASAAGDLLGTPRLTSAERGYLDELGNRNGRYDVGDLLAHYRRLGQPFPAALLKLTGQR